MDLWNKLFGPPSKDQFARMMVQSIQRAGEPGPIQYDRDGFRLKMSGENELTFFLGNLYAEYNVTPRSGRQELLRNAVRSWFSRHKEIPAEFEDLGPDLLPGVRSRSYFELIRLQGQLEGGPPFDWPYQLLAEHLGVCPVYDLPESIMMLQQPHLESWGVSLEEALETACRNLLDMSRHEFDQPLPGVWVSPWRDNHDAARLVLGDLMRHHHVEGDHVAMVPHRDTLLLTGTADDDGLEHLAALAEEAIKRPRPLTGIAFRLEGDGWVPYLPPADHPQYERYLLLRMASLGQDYAEQKELLDAIHKNADQDIYVARYAAGRSKETGRVESHSVWSQGVETFLPRTDRVYFFVPKSADDGDIVASGDWERVSQVVGDLMTDLDTYPIRYRVTEFPTEEQLAAIRRSL